MRIIAGELRHRNIETLPGDTTRPTADKVKESIFNSVGPYFDGGIMLDLFGGSGNIAFEALSRGFEKAWITDMNLYPYRTICLNAKNLGVMDRCRIAQLNYKDALSLAHEKGIQFDMIYIDPPYDLKVIDEILNYLNIQKLVAPNGLVLCESSIFDSFAAEYGSLKRISEKLYRVARISVYRNEA